MKLCTLFRAYSWSYGPLHCRGVLGAQLLLHLASSAGMLAHCLRVLSLICYSTRSLTNDGERKRAVRARTGVDVIFLAPPFVHYARQHNHSRILVPRSSPYGRCLWTASWILCAWVEAALGPRPRRCSTPCPLTTLVICSAGTLSSTPPTLQAAILARSFPIRISSTYSLSLSVDAQLESPCPRVRVHSALGPRS